MCDPSEVVLDIENIPIKCSKKDLIENSDYFRAMFEGNFAERNQTSIKLEGIDSKSMNIILTLLWDDTYFINDEDILFVLQTACMLQFERIRENCIQRLTEILSPENCVKIWFSCEPLDLKPLYFKSKNLALMEFDSMKELECLLELDIVQLHKYLSNIYLQCKTEMDVFFVCMKWFYEYLKTRPTSDNKTQVELIKSLLMSIDFKSISDTDVQEMILTFEMLTGKEFIVCVLKCIIDTRNNIDVINTYDTSVIILSVKLMNCRKRVGQIPTDPLFFVKNFGGNTSTIEIFEDPYKRKRKYVRLEDGAETDLNVHKKSGAIVIFDERHWEIIKLIDISEEKFKGHEGFHIVGYKEQIFMFGGEVTLGSGNWNWNFWVYDTIRERWERKTKLPFRRRHFHSVICGNYLYIIGGTGSFRIIQENMFWYNYKENIWSKQIVLPCSSMQLKCCNYKNQLFLLNINNKTGYLFIPATCSFVTLHIFDKKNIVPTYPDNYTLFSVEDTIYIKGSSLIELQVESDNLIVINYRTMEPINCDNMESIVCDDIVYSLFKYNHTKTVTVELFSLKTNETKHLFQNVSDETVLKAQQGNISFGINSKLFTLQHHYKMCEKDVFVNNL